MSDVLHRTTKVQKYSVHTPDYSAVDWIINPDLSGVVGIPVKYWLITGDVVSEMNQSEKDAVDAILLPGQKTAKKASLRTEGDQLIENQSYSAGKQRSLISQYTKSSKVKPKREQYVRNFLSWIEDVDEEVILKQDLVDDQTSESGVNSVILDAAGLISADPGTTIATTLDTTDSSSLDNFLDSNAEVTDPLTGVIGPWDQMQILNHRRELYNDSSNPLYLVDKTAILGPTGYLVDYASRINNLESIHSKLGWLNQQMVEATYTRPQDMLIYYGWLNSFNSAVHSWSNEKVSQEMAEYRLLVFGNGIANPGHGDYANTQIIVDRVKALSNHTKIFGYVSTDQVLGDFTNEVIEWGNLGVNGIFMDEAGYDFGRTRKEFNDRVDYVHDRTSTNLCFANAWNTKHILGTENDPSYPNSTYNNPSNESKLADTDWILLESFPINTASYDSTPMGYESKTDWIYRGDTMKLLRATYGVNFAGVGMINNANADGSALSDFGFTSAMMYNLEGYGTSDTNYGASSAAVKKWIRPDVTQMGVTYCLNCTVKVDGDDSDVYHRYAENGRFTLDFSDNSNQSNTILKY